MHADTGLLSPGWADTAPDDLLGDRAWLEAMIAFEVALARVQAEAGVVPPGTAEAIAEAGDPERFDWAALVRGVRETGNPVVGFVGQLTDLVRRVDPTAAEHVHLGGTSQDVLDTAAMLVVRNAFERVRDDLRSTAGALAGHVRAHRGSVMAGRTLTQHAVPITFGLKAAGWLSGVLDALDRVERVLDGGLPVSLGGAAGTLAAYAEFGPARVLDLVGPLAAELGLAAPDVPWHSTRTPVADVAAALAVVGGALGRIAVDVAVLTRTEVGEVAEGSAPGRGASSAMPQKRNPVRSTAIAAAARQVPGLVAVLHQCAVVEDERSAGGWHAEWQPLREALRLVCGAARNAAALTSELVVFPERMRRNAELTGGAIVSERLGAVLAPVLGKAEAKAVLAEATAATADRPERLPEVLAAALRERGHERGADHWRALCDPAGYTGAAEALADRVLRRYGT
ncbi:3-carboxy-cis,cis-muconate cycloisomerase [Saccharothrix syringae]|uniref:3-carboxy-cis,cis-muconate cycloisomerase n=1 Tax=Saccharothrix syringae TaxID=103733 RepID=A0A5Q0GWE4_SACSY|nr:3-carboxy-cis,cis-muconate cycloisomerase [Saccharothrix syringae]QFZ17790.1 3-carboxy-cis,cis-muconate cycloisomerase [Saccharothrix syringae]